MEDPSDNNMRGGLQDGADSDIEEEETCTDCSSGGEEDDSSSEESRGSPLCKRRVTGFWGVELS